MNDNIKEQMPLIMTILITVVVLVGGIGLLAVSSGDSLSTEEKDALLIKENSHVANNPEASIKVVEFSDFECSACATYYPELKQIKEEYPEDITFVYRHFPLRSIHPNAQRAAEASEAAASQDKFWEYHDILFENQTEWATISNTEELNDKFAEYAKEVELEDLENFEQDIANRTYQEKVNQDLADAESLNLRGTPTVFLNGKRVANPTYDSLSQQINELLSN